MTKASAVGKPLDFDDLAFWAHGQIAKAALVHIRFGVRDGNGEWEEDLGFLKGYLRWFEGRFGIYGTLMTFVLRRKGKRDRDTG
jgi:hypothetical protein